jgi:hypothetical protein
MEAEHCSICKQNHRADYRVWSEVFQQFMSAQEFTWALTSGKPLADVTSHLHVFELPPL